MKNKIKIINGQQGLPEHKAMYFFKCTSTHTYILQLTRAHFQYLLNPIAEILNMTTGRKVGSTSVPPKPDIATFRDASLQTCVAHDVFFVKLPNRNINTGSARRGVGLGGWGRKAGGAHRKRHHPIKLCSLGHV